MKIRNGFVSNSSSSSFCIVGIYLDENDIDDYFPSNVTFKEDELNSSESEEKISIWDLDMKDNIKVHHPEGDGWYIGIDINEMNDSQTLKEFKESIEKTLKANGIKNISYNDIDIYNETYYS